jgi:hypothetical protein
LQSLEFRQNSYCQTYKPDFVKKLHFISALLLFFFCYLTSPAQQLDWVKTFESQNTSISKSVDVDGSGNVIIWGGFDGITDFDPGPGVETGGNALNGDFVLKLDANGDFLWVRTYPDSIRLLLSSMDIGFDGSIYLSGSIEGTMDIDPGPGVQMVTSTLPWADAVVIKLDSQGNLVWAKKVESDLSDANLVVADSDGNCYLTGYFKGAADLDPGPNQHSVSSSQNDMFLLKLDASGNLVWANHFEGIGGINSRGKLVDVFPGKNGVVIGGGYFRGSIDFDAGSNSHTMNAASQDGFTFKLDAAGQLLWANRTGNGGTIYSGLVDGDEFGNVYVIGTFVGGCDFDPGAAVTAFNAEGNPDSFLQKFDWAGNLVFARHFRGTIANSIQRVTVDDWGNIRLLGTFHGVADLDPGPNDLLSDPGPGRDAYIVGLHSSGDLAWAGTIMGNPQWLGLDMCETADGGLLVCGGFEGTTDFDPGPGVTNVNSSQNYTAFLQKLSLPAVGIVEESAIDFSMYPNPSRGEVQLEFDQGAATVEVIDLLGRVRSERRVVNGSVEVDLPEEPGMYLVRVTIKGRSVTKRVIRR